MYSSSETGRGTFLGPKIKPLSVLFLFKRLWITTPLCIDGIIGVLYCKSATGSTIELWREFRIHALATPSVSSASISMSPFLYYLIYCYKATDSYVTIYNEVDIAASFPSALIILFLGTSWSHPRWVCDRIGMSVSSTGKVSKGIHQWPSDIACRGNSCQSIEKSARDCRWILEGWTASTLALALWEGARIYVIKAILIIKRII